MNNLLSLIFILNIANLDMTDKFEGRINHSCPIKNYSAECVCDNFKTGDIVTYSYFYIYSRSTDFVGIVIKIESKPTSENLHWVTVKRISGKGESGTYSEQFLMPYKERDINE